MIDGDDIKVLEYNARFGDPETQCVLPRLRTSLTDIFLAVTDGRLSGENVEWSDAAAVCVVIASGGYPVKYEKGKPVTIGALDPDAMLFHAGTAFDASGGLVTNGGRVFGVTALGNDLKEAREKAYSNAGRVSFQGAYYRKDIGKNL
jgi:phosphoribosylamine--glycine ligase